MIAKTMTKKTDDYRSSATISTLKEMAKLCRKARNFFDTRGFFEVMTPVLSHDVLTDLYVEPIRVDLNKDRFYLQTSPEFAMKRLLSSGADQIYQIAHAFRYGDRGTTHNIEFSLLEWYRMGDGYQEGMDLLADLAAELLDRPRPTIRTFEELFFETTGLNPHTAEIPQLYAWCDRHQVLYPESYRTGLIPAQKDDWLDLIFSEKIQPNLGNQSSLILCDYPDSQSQLAQTRTIVDRGERYRVSERFELFADGLELANGYNELTDAEELRRRFKQIAQERAERKLPALPTESRLLKAMDAGLPKSSGCALGLERTLMVRLGVHSIDEVIPFPTERA